MWLCTSVVTEVKHYSLLRFCFTSQTIGYIEIISDGLQAAATLDRSVLDALPVQNIIFLPEKLKIGPVDKVVDGQQSAALAADQEHLWTTVADVLCN